MNVEEYKNLVLLKENLGKLKHSPLSSDSGFQKLFNVMRDHCDYSRLGGPMPLPRRRPPSAEGPTEFKLEASLTSIFVLLSHMLVEVGRTRERHQSKLQLIQKWFANQLPGLYDSLSEQQQVFAIQFPKQGKISVDAGINAANPVTKERFLFSEAEKMNDVHVRLSGQANCPTIKPTTTRKTEPNNAGQKSETPHIQRRPMSASTSMVYLNNVMKRVFPDEDVLTQLQFANRRGMAFAQRYTAHNGGERPERALLNGIRQIVQDNADEEASSLRNNSENGDIIPRCKSAIDPSLVDKVATELEHRRERVAATPSRGFRQPVVSVDPNANIVNIPPMLISSNAPPPSPRGLTSSDGIDMRRAGALLMTPSRATKSVKNNQTAELPENTIISHSPVALTKSSDDVINVRSTPLPPPSPGKDDSGNRTASPIAPNSIMKPRISSAPITNSRKSTHSSSTAARMFKHRQQLHQASRESAGFKTEQQADPEHELKDVLSVKFLLRSRSNRSSYGRFSMRDHFKMLRQMSAQSRSSTNCQATTPTFFSFCASATKRHDEDDSDDDFDIYNSAFRATTPQPQQQRRPHSSTNIGSYGSDILALVSQVDSAMEFSRSLQKELEMLNAKQTSNDDERPEKLLKNLEHVSVSVPIYKANLIKNPDVQFEIKENHRKAALLIQRIYRGFRVRRQIANITELLLQMDTILKGFVPAPKGSEPVPTEWRTEAKLYKRIIERILIYRQEVYNRNSGEKYPRRVNRPTVKFTLEDFTRYLEAKVLIGTEFRRRAIGGTVAQNELPAAFKSLGVSATLEQLEIALTERFGMRYRYKTRPLPVIDFIDLFWTLRSPAGTPAPKKPSNQQHVATSEVELQNVDAADQLPSTFITEVDKDDTISILEDQQNAEQPPPYSAMPDRSNDLEFRVSNPSRPRSAMPASSGSSGFSSVQVRPASSNRQKSPLRTAKPSSRPSSVKSPTRRKN